jgi:hypothetical protein
MNLIGVEVYFEGYKKEEVIHVMCTTSLFDFPTICEILEPWIFCYCISTIALETLFIFTIFEPTI